MRNMTIELTEHIMSKFPTCAARYKDGRKIRYIPAKQSSDDQSVKANSAFKKVNKIGQKADTFAKAIFEHVKMGPKISETMKGKMRLGARILRVGGVRKIFKRLFITREGEKLLKCSQCYLSTTAGPLAGIFFISTDKVAFCSERSLKCFSPDGMLLKYRYKVVLPLEKIKRVDQIEDAKKPSQKYMKITTFDNFDFWFMGFLNCEKSLKSLQQVLYPVVLKERPISESCMVL